MALPFTYLFLGLLAAYMVFSEWQRIDSRYLIVGGLVLLVVAAIVDAAGATASANTIAVFVFLLLAGGVILLLVDHVRESPAAPATDGPRLEGGDGGTQNPPGDPSDQRKAPSQELLDRLQQ